MILVVLSILVTLVQLWWAIAHLYAYMQTQERLLLTQVAQGAVFGLLFIMISIEMITQMDVLNPLIATFMLIVGVILGMMWRRKNGIHVLIDYYPRAMIDVLLFRKPTTDVKQ